MHASLGKAFFAEVLGTFLLVLFGCGAVHTAVLMGAQVGLWQVAIVWGVGIMLAIYITADISSAHLNPAVTLAFAATGRIPVSRVVPYIVAQVAGAIVAAGVLFALFGPYLTKKETENGVERGKPGSEITAMCYCQYYPNPGGIADGTKKDIPAELEKIQHLVPTGVAFGAEVLGTAILLLVIFAVTDHRNDAAPQSKLAPVFIGLTVSALISVIAPLTQACFNPARDFGPRMFAYFAGWGEIAWPGLKNTGWLTVYIAAPISGAVCGALLYDLVLRKPDKI